MPTNGAEEARGLHEAQCPPPVPKRPCPTVLRAWGRGLARLAAKRPAYGDEVKGLGFVDLGKGSRLAGFTSGLVLCAGWRRWRGRGPRARLLPYVAGKRVVPDSLHPGFGGDGRGCPWSLAGCDPDAEAGSPRPVSYGALGYAAAAAPFAGPSRPPLAMAGSQAVPVVRTAWS